MNVSAESRAAAMLCDEEISDGGEGRYETLQTPADRKPFIWCSRFRSGR
jgi:hypothetical protein